MPIPNSLDELGKSIESGVSDATHTVKKSASQTAQDVKTQTDFVKALYSPSESPAGQSVPTEAGIEQVPQGGGQQQPQVPQKAESTKSNAEKFGPLADQFRILPGQGEDAHKSSMGSLQETVLPGLTDPGKTVSLGDQLTGNDVEKNKFGGVDPTKQMTAEEQAKYTDAQKELRELQRLHNQSYVKGPLDVSSSVDQDIAKERQRRMQAEQQAIKDEEDRKRQEEEKKAQEQQQLVEPTTKAKPGDPNIATNRAKTTTEINRGTSG